MGNFWSGASAGGERDWAGLPDELLGAIAERLPIPNHARFRAVCTAWSSAHHPPSLPHFPWLMLDRSGPHHSFLDVGDSRPYRLRGPDEGSRTCVGSRGGRLVILDVATDVATLINPVSRTIIDLPSLRTLPWSKAFFNVRKVAASDDGERPVVLALVYSLSRCYLAFALAGDTAWTPLDFLSPPSQRIEDVAYHDNKFFVVFTRGRVQWFDLNGSVPEASRLLGSCADVTTTHYAVHLVSSAGKLLQVRREREVLTGTSTKLTVTKFDPESDSGWADIKDLGDESLFLDTKVSMSLSARDDSSMRRNCIYFADDAPHSGKIKVGDLKTFDVATGVVEPFRLRNYRGGDVQLMSPIWFTPSLF